MRSPLVYLIFAFGFAGSFSSCSESQNARVKSIVENDDVNALRNVIESEIKREKHGLGVINIALRKALEKEQADASNAARVTLLTKALHALAQKNIRDRQSVPTLIDALEKQIWMPDTFYAADTLRLITGVDTGYTLSFVDSYKSDNETERKMMIVRWKEWWKENQQKP